MKKCFVIQPFDARFDKRFDDVYKPAIEAAELEAYRVDQDHSVDVPIDSIEEEIRDSSVCLADITLDNPNVWYELGYAYASKRPVVMICSDERMNRKYPFDIQHRTIIPYKVDSLRDFEALKNAITKRIIATLKKRNTLSTIAESQAVAPSAGLSQPELALMAAAASSVTLPEDEISIWSIKRDLENSGFTGIAFALGIKRLKAKEYIHTLTTTNYNGEEYDALSLTSIAWEWIEKNEDKFMLKKEGEPLEEELPF